jgi:hypothetical protein
MAGARDAGKERRTGGEGAGPARPVGPSSEERKRERAGACMGRAHVRLGRARGEGIAGPCLPIFVFLLKKCEIVIVFVYFSGIFVELQKY